MALAAEELEGKQVKTLKRQLAEEILGERCLVVLEWLLVFGKWILFVFYHHLFVVLCRFL